MIKDGTEAPVVRLTGLAKTFGQLRAVDGVDLDVAAGQVFGFLGPNGAGKSTTIRMMMGLTRPTSGRVALFGLDVGRHGSAVRRRTGYLPGELRLYPRLTGRDLLDRICRLRGDVDPSRRAGMERRFGAQLDRPLHNLSKGNQQKVGLVLAFMADPDLLVLDEPTFGLDPLLQQEFSALLQESVDRGRTVFLSSHDLEEVQRLAHRVAIIREGRLVACDTVAALRGRAGRTVSLTFRAPVDPGAFSAVPGAVLQTADGTRATFRVSGEVGPLLQAAVPHQVVDVTARPADLDELFLDFYRAGSPTPRGPQEVGSGAR